MSWKKLGRIVNLETATSRSTNHMQGPVAIVLDNRIRVYFSARNINGKSYPAYVDLDKTNPQEVLKIYDQPIMSYGPLGTFNDVLLISHNKMGFSSLHLYSER